MSRFPGIEDSKLIKVIPGIRKENSSKLKPAQFILPMTKQEIIDKIMSEVVIESIPLHKGAGGQQVNFYTYRMRISHPEIDFIIESGESRSVTDNKELIITLYKLGLEELIRG